MSVVKRDISELKTEMRKEFANAHKQSNTNVMTILAGMFGVGVSTVVASQILHSHNDNVTWPERAKKR